MACSPSAAGAGRQGCAGHPNHGRGGRRRRRPAGAVEAVRAASRSSAGADRRSSRPAWRRRCCSTSASCSVRSAWPTPPPSPGSTGPCARRLVQRQPVSQVLVLSVIGITIRTDRRRREREQLHVLRAADPGHGRHGRRVLRVAHRRAPADRAPGGRLLARHAGDAPEPEHHLAVPRADDPVGGGAPGDRRDHASCCCCGSRCTRSCWPSSSRAGRSRSPPSRSRSRGRTAPPAARASCWRRPRTAIRASRSASP